MRLSPMTRFQAANVLQCRHVDAKTDRRKVEEVTMYRCPECLELHDWEDDAEECCAEKDMPTPNGGDLPDCPACGEKYSGYRDASDCCLWHDLDAPTRWKVADAVEAGSDWATELGLTENPSMIDG